MASQDKSKTGEKTFSALPLTGENTGFSATKANPGPVITNNLPAEEGTKADRQAKKAELNSSK